MHEIARNAIEQMPPETRVDPEHAEVILRHKDALLGLTDGIVDGFYETVYSHPQTSAVFVEGERPAREKTLADWWTRTVEGPLDDDYWAWMALVGLTHVIRRVTNPMMLSMTGFVAQYVEEHSNALDVSAEERQLLISAIQRITSAVGAIITFAYDQAVSSALFEVAGMPEALLARLRDQEVSSALARAHEERNA